MKKLIFLSLGLLFLASCREEVISNWDNLTAAERAELQARATQKCTSEYQSVYNHFKNESDDVFTSSSYNREKGFYSEYKTGNDVKRKIDIRVWKRDSNAREIYFYVTETYLGPTSYFLRITQTENDAMIDSLFSNHCSKTYTSSTGSGGPLTFKYEYNIPNSAKTDEYTDTYTQPFTELAYFSNFHLSRYIKSIVTSTGNQTGTVTYSSTLVAKAYDFDSDTYSDTTYYTQNFCEVKEVSAGVYKVGNVATDFGYQLDCSTTLPTGWNLTP